MLSEVLDSQNYQFGVDALLAIIASTVILILGVFTLIREWKSPIRYSYLIFSFSLFIIFFCSIFTRISSSVNVMPFWDVGSHIGLLLLPPAFIYFSSEVLQRRQQNQKLIFLSCVLSFCLLLILLFSDHFVAGYKQFPWGFEAEYGGVGIIFGVYLCSVVAYVLLMYWQIMQRSNRGSVLWQRAKWLLISNLIGFMAVIDLAPSFGFEIYPIGSVFIVFLFVLMSVVTWRFKLLDIDAKYAAESIIKTMSEALIVLDEKFNVRLTNVAAAKLCESSGLEAMRLFLRDKILSLHCSSESPTEIRDLELEYSEGSVGPQFLNLSISLIKETEDDALAYVCVFRDISKRKNTEKELHDAYIGLERRVAERTRSLSREIEERKKTEKHLISAKEEAELANKAKGKFLANISHELRTPMHAILSFSKLGENKIDVAKKEKIKKYFQNITVSGNRLLALLNDLLDLSRLESGKFELNFQSVDLESLTRLCVNSHNVLLGEKNIHCHIEVDSVDLEVICDRNQIAKVVNNLLENAIKYSPKGGDISIVIKSAVINASNFNDGLRKVPGVLFSIEDQGEGIPDGELKKVFGKFTQSSSTDTGSGGIGMGLAICSEIIHLHKGYIYAEHGKKGARFIFSIPLNPSD